MELLCAIILAHVIADFLLQTPRIAAQKEAGLPRGYLLHFAGHLFSLILLTHLYFSPALAALWIALPAAHLIVDWSKNRLFPPEHPAGALVFVLDQALHLGLIFLAWQWVNPPPCPPVASFYRSLLSPAGRTLMEHLFRTGAAPFLLTAAVSGFVIFGGAVLVRKTLDSEALALSGTAGKLDAPRRAGRYIGMLERAIILSLTLADAFTSIAFVLTAKSIARYRELGNRAFAEYYLVGTLLSTLLAILGGLFLKATLP